MLFRCSLCRISQRALVLQAAHRLLRPGGLVVATDWVQTRVTDRTTWARIVGAGRFVDLETEPGYVRSSWLIDDRNSLLAALAASAVSREWRPDRRFELSVLVDAPARAQILAECSATSPACESAHSVGSLSRWGSRRSSPEACTA